MNLKAPELDYPKPAFTADTVPAALFGDSLKFLLIRRKREPFSGRLAISGGFVEPFEEPLTAARRELFEETGISTATDFSLVGVYGKPGRDPRGWTVSAAYLVFLGRLEARAARAGDDAADFCWLDAASVLEAGLAFDHGDIFRDSLRKIVDFTNGGDTLPAVAAALLEESFDSEEVERCRLALAGIQAIFHSKLPELLEPGNASELSLKIIAARAS